MDLECTECSAPLKPNATHCLECGAPIVNGPPAPATMNVGSMAPLPLYGGQPAPSYSGGGQLAAASAQPAGFEPPLLQPWMERLRTMPPLPPAAPGQASAAPSMGRDTPNLLVRAVYFLLIGIWASQLWIIFAWLISLTIIGLPVGLAMVRALPMVALLSPTRIRTNESRHGSAPQTSFGLRAIYFLLMGWWISLVWMELAWVAGVTIIGLPLSVAMFALTPTVATLARP